MCLYIVQSFILEQINLLVIYVPVGECKSLCKKIEEGTASRMDYRRAGQYSVSVYEQHFQSLLLAGDIRLVGENTAILINPDIYDPCKGLSIQSDAGKSIFI